MIAPIAEHADTAMSHQHFAAPKDLTTKKIIGEGRETNGLYLLNTSIPKAAACVGIESPLEIHYRLDSVNEGEASGDILFYTTSSATTPSTGVPPIIQVYSRRKKPFTPSVIPESLPATLTDQPPTPTPVSRPESSTPSLDPNHADDLPIALRKDAMALVQQFGKPDLFLTITCNPNWPEIKESLRCADEAQNRPDLIAQIFNGRIHELKIDLFQRKIYGEKVAPRLCQTNNLTGVISKHVVGQVCSEGDVTNKNVNRRTVKSFMLEFQDSRNGQNVSYSIRRDVRNINTTAYSFPGIRSDQYIASYILRGRSGNHPQMSRDDAMLIYAILKPVSVNWGKYILSYMNLCRAKKKALPYPMLLTFLLKTKGFEFLSTESDSETAFWRIKRATVMRVKIDTEEEREEAGPSHSRIASRSNKVTLPMLFKSLQSLQTSFNNIQLQQATYGYNLNKMLVKSGEQWETPSMEALAPYMSQGSSSQAAPFDDEGDDVDEDDDDAEKEDADHLDATMDEE
ncbi:unnamed protein product [Cuscuta campestris]|uniref:Helitron helicase-like domain-containing protein n=1 Tax=Cuscuta campestris TaxID=132261 RepID=A0A484KNZ1_9ASTE|nr:unnamed protein product [Cuscuta campestris]